MVKKQELTLEEKEEKVRDFRPIDDAFFETLADDRAFCQEILRVILSDKKLVVEDVIVQNSKRNLYGRSVRLDALCTLGNGTKCNIEVQRSNNDNHLKRVRYNAASIAVVDSQRGDKFRELEDLYVVYISEFDVFHGGYTKYHVDSVVRETGKKVKDGLERVFVNTEIKDGTELEGDLIPTLIDELPVIAVMAACANGETIIRNAEELKVKESNRLEIIVHHLSEMGCDITGTEDGMIIRGGKSLHGAVLDSHLDHRIAMSFAVAGLVADGETEITNADCVTISYPGFYRDLLR